MTQTGFKRWREKMGLTQEQAAQALGVSKSQVSNWDAGIDRSAKCKSAPNMATRTLMTLLIRGEIVQAWPE